MTIGTKTTKRNISAENWRNHRIRNLKVRLAFATIEIMQEKQISVEELSDLTGASVEVLKKIVGLSCVECSLDELVDCLFRLDPSVQLIFRRGARGQPAQQESESRAAKPVHNVSEAKRTLN